MTLTKTQETEDQKELREQHESGVDIDTFMLAFLHEQ